jgi:alkylation response protein AidB-like acyl-CoA dehydrogenase
MLATGVDRVLPYLEAIQNLSPLITQHRESSERERRVSQSVYDKLADAGLFRLWLPEALGGPGLSPSEFLTVVEAVAALDGSVGWIVGNGGGMSRAGGYLPEATARKLFTDAKAFVASSTAAVGTALEEDGGFRISGKWFFASGAHHATWFMGLCASKNPDGTDSPIFCCYLPREKVTIHDTWHVSGLRGTGSCEFEASDVFVPNEHTHDLVRPKATQPGVLYQLPGISAFGWTVAVVPLGIARGAIDTFKEMATRKTRAGTASVMCERELIQSMVGRVETLHAASRALLVNAMADLMDATKIGGQELVRARINVRAAAVHAAESSVRIVDMIAAEAGAIAIFESCPLERSVRDLHAVAKHIAMSPNSYATAGRIALGLDPGTARF